MERQLAQQQQQRQFTLRALPSLREEIVTTATLPLTLSHNPRGRLIRARNLFQPPQPTFQHKQTHKKRSPGDKSALYPQKHFIASLAVAAASLLFNQKTPLLTIEIFGYQHHRLLPMLNHPASSSTSTTSSTTN